MKSEIPMDPLPATDAGSAALRGAAPAEGEERPNGPVAAVMIAAGLGALALGILTTLAEASESFKESLQYNDGVGPLAGKTILTVVVFLVTWAGLGGVLRRRDVPWGPVIVGTLVLVGLGLIGTFPPFFQAFAPTE